MGDGKLMMVRPNRFRVPLLVRMVWRYLVTGRELHGQGDNATFLHDATIDFRNRPYERLTRARWRRVARRWLVLLSAAIAFAFWILYGIVAALSVLSVPIIAAATYGVVRLASWWPDRHLVREYVRPAAQVLCKVTGARYRRSEAARLIELPRGFGRGVEDDGGGEPVAVRVNMPGVFALPQTLKDRIVSAMGGTLGLPGCRGEWREAGSRPYVDIYPAPTPPRSVTLAEVRRAMEAAPLHQPVAGLAAGRRVVSVDLEQDSPHVTASGPSGTGKSVLFRFLLSQRMRHGAGLMVLDYKRWSHRWLHDMPPERVQYLWRIADIHNGLVAVGEELQRRIEAPAEEQEGFRPVDIVVEEINSTIRALNRYWKGKRRELMANAKMLAEMEADYDPADLDPPLQSPAVAALQEGVGMGRELKMHWWVAAQRLSAAVFGGNGGDIRESFQVRFIAKWDRKLWKMLVDGLRYVAYPAGPRGIWGCNIGEEFHIFRVPFLTDQEARRWALGGVPVYGPVLGPQSSAPVIEEEPRRAISRNVTLREALEELPEGADGERLTLQTLQRSSTRPGFPPFLTDGEGQPLKEGAAFLYDLHSLLEWRKDRLAHGGPSSAR